MNKPSLQAHAAIGKRVGGALYLHRTGLDHAPEGATTAVRTATQMARLSDGEFSVVKLEGTPVKRVSLLAYEDFDENAFPALLDSWTVDLKTAEVFRRTYRTSANPPILHRKELLLPPDDPRRQGFAQLTQELERRGLFEGAKSIGFRRAWHKRLSEAGIAVQGHTVIEAAPADAPQPATEANPVERHRTALARNGLSAPMQALARHGFLEGSHTVFDYGCGRGGDLEILSAAGLSARGWDPYYAPDAPCGAADVVNLGYVVNVIEDSEQRLEAIRKAFGLARQVLCVAVMVVGKADTTGLKPHLDGFLTARGTFQKYYTQEEARALIEEATEQEAIPVAPGIFLVFRDKIAEQRFLEARHRRRRDISHLLAIAPTSLEIAPGQDDTLINENRELFETVWERSLELGRLPHEDELAGHVAREVVERIGSIRKAAQLAQRLYDPSALARQRETRVIDLTVYFALNRFNGRQKYRELPSELQRDVRAFFGSYSHADHLGQELLFSLGDPETILAACHAAADNGLGHLFGEHSLQLHSELIDRLPASLRAYVGCAEKLYGDIGPESADLIKIHTHSGKLTLLRFDDFIGKALPRLTERIKIDMRKRDINYFDYGQDKKSPRLTLKSRYMASDQEGYDQQKQFDEQLEALGLFDFSGYGPSATDLARGLTRAGYRVAGFRLIQANADT